MLQILWDIRCRSSGAKSFVLFDLLPSYHSSGVRIYLTIGFWSLRRTKNHFSKLAPDWIQGVAPPELNRLFVICYQDFTPLEFAFI